MKKYYLFTQRGLTARYFCGTIYHKLPTDEIRVNGDLMTFEDAEQIGSCLAFEDEDQAQDYAISQWTSLNDDNEYARQAMDDEDHYQY